MSIYKTKCHLPAELWDSLIWQNKKENPTPRFTIVLRLTSWQAFGNQGMISKHRPCFYTRHKWRTLWPRSFFVVTSWCEQLWTDEVAWGLSSVQVSFLQIHLCFLRNNLNCPLTAEESLQMCHLWHPPFNEPFNIISTVLPTVRVSPTFQEKSKKKLVGWSCATWVSSVGFLGKNQGKLILFLAFV